MPRDKSATENEVFGYGLGLAVEDARVLHIYSARLENQIQDTFKGDIVNLSDILQTIELLEARLIVTKLEIIHKYDELI